MEPGENEWLRAAERERDDERGSLSQNNTSNYREREGERERRTYEGCLYGGCAIWQLIGRGGTCCSGRGEGWGQSLRSPREGGGDYAAP